MRAIIKFKNEQGKTEYLAPYTDYTEDINDAYLFNSVSEAEWHIERATTEWVGCPPIWKTAKAVEIKIVEL